jgi:hypothetical protein
MKPLPFARIIIALEDHHPIENLSLFIKTNKKLLNYPIKIT